METIEWASVVERLERRIAEMKGLDEDRLGTPVLVPMDTGPVGNHGLIDMEVHAERTSRGLIATTTLSGPGLLDTLPETDRLLAAHVNGDASAITHGTVVANPVETEETKANELLTELDLATSQEAVDEAMAALVGLGREAVLPSLLRRFYDERWTDTYTNLVAAADLVITLAVDEDGEAVADAIRELMVSDLVNFRLAACVLLMAVRQELRQPLAAWMETNERDPRVKMRLRSTLDAISLMRQH